MSTVVVDGFFCSFESAFETVDSRGDACCDCRGGLGGKGGADVVWGTGQLSNESKEGRKGVGVHVRRGTAKAKALRKPRTMTEVYCILDRLLPTGLMNETVFL